MINIGQYIESAINWMMVHFSTFFDAVNSGIGSFIIGFQHVLFGIPFYITILALAVAAWMKAGRGTAIFTVLGLLLIYGMGFWEATMQTLALVLSSTCLALVSQTHIHLSHLSVPCLSDLPSTGLHLHLYRLPYLFVQSHPYVDSLFLPNRHISQDAPVYTWEKKGSYNLLHCLRPWKQERSYGEKHNV